MDEKVFKGEMMTTKTMCCSICKQDNITWRVWADENNKVQGSCEELTCYCDDCEKETLPILKMDHNLKGIS
ncbi:hypothetical protein [Marinobacter sp.]|uniref:hypothetical protein n=1 Tax=Marinobacter sp. TaxID=50741 RepID=UPI002354C5A5|nr:hypothetical protein [Marinobacter sp.]